jgi:hypothetical protein
MNPEEEATKRREVFMAWSKTHPKPTAEEVVGLLAQMGKPSTITDPDADPSKVRCACNKLVPCERVAIVNTGHITAVDPVCPPCRNDFADQARLVCVRCRSVIGWLDPCVDPHGFRFDKKHFYHVGSCAVCKKGLTKSDIIEMMLYYEANGIPYEKNEIID